MNRFQKSSPLKLGLERCLEERPSWLSGRRLGLLLNQASVDRHLDLACYTIESAFPKRLTALFSPQHGLWGEQQANMIESDHSQHQQLGIPIFSLYSETRAPTPEMLDQIDCLAIDLHDVGTRVYTFIWTMLECLRACAAAGKSVIILDRPNPLGGEVIEGPMLDPGYESFVGETNIPLRHGLTIGELAKLFAHELRIDVDLQIVALQGWSRQDLFSDLQRPWIWPSPNMQSFQTALAYPGQVLLEGTNLSEGRGTTLPFEVCGAPFLQAESLAEKLKMHAARGIHCRPLRFRPTFDKWMNQSCEGVQLHFLDARQARSVIASVHLIVLASQMAPEQFRWLDPPYEYEYHKPPIDILFGSPRLREFVRDVNVRETVAAEDLEQLCSCDLQAWSDRTSPHLLY